MIKSKLKSNSYNSKKLSKSIDYNSIILKLQPYLILLFIVIAVFVAYHKIPNTGFNQYVININPLHSNQYSNSTKCFAIIGDFRGNYNVTKLLLKHAISHTNYVIFNGDYSFFPESSAYSKLFKMIDGVQKQANKTIKQFFIPGNHDIINGYKEYYKYFGNNNFIIELNYSNKMPLFLLGLDNARGNFYDLSPIYLYGKKIIIAHYPIYDPYEKTCKFCSLTSSFIRHNVILYIASHVHGWYAETVNGVFQLISAGGGAELRDFKDKNYKKYNYLLMCINDDYINLEYRDINDSVFWFKKLLW